jgi:hypothetical protein
MDKITHDQLLMAVSYDPETGLFWSRARSRVRPMGIQRHGYWYVSIERKAYRAARLAWFYVHGEWPKHHVDHINGDRMDNRIANLRDITRQANNQNIHRPFRTNKTGFLGVDFDKSCNKYRASIRHAGKNVTLGRFDTPEEAHRIYVDAKRSLHEGCTL